VHVDFVDETTIHGLLMPLGAEYIDEALFAPIDPIRFEENSPNFGKT
jgi:hypothetical protein